MGIENRINDPATSVLVHPRTWKGNVPKPVHQKRIIAALDAEERAMVEGKRHDVVDAVGLGLWKLGRM